jgi:hypothetical protein
MTRKDYVALAAAINGVRQEAIRCDGYAANIPSVVDAVADVLAADNPLFDRDRFVEACYA